MKLVLLSSLLLPRFYQLKTLTSCIGAVVLLFFLKVFSKLVNLDEMLIFGGIAVVDFLCSNWPSEGEDFELWGFL
jgi:hypothetical protein